MAELNTAPPTDDIRSALAAAIAEHDEPIPAKEPSKAKDEPAGDKPERQRGQDGKFAKEPAESKPAKAQTETEPELELEPEKRETEAEEIAEPEADEKPAEPKPLDPPANWKAADKETFKKLAPEAQQIMLSIQKGMDADYTKKTQAIAALKSEYEPVDKIFEPYRDVMKQRGFTPRTLIEAWANVEKKLSSGEQSALDVITGLINTYHVPVAKVASAFGIRPQTQAAPQPAKDGEVPAVADQAATQSQLPPEVIQFLQGLEQKVNGLTANQQAAQQNAQAARQAAVMNDIEKFKSAADEKGTLLHPHFEEVEADMASLALVAKTAGQQVPALSELYEKAVWANPSTREKLITAKEQQVEEKRKAEARAKAAAAKKAAGSVTGAPGPGQASNVRSAERSLREELESAAEDMAAA